MHCLDLEVSYVAIDDLENCWITVIATIVELAGNLDTITTRLETFQTELSLRIRRQNYKAAKVGRILWK